ncbi:MAG: lysophospholipase [Omnitrophica bacterium]|nr:lysophospholipase [Candidatus Omnitrophota bacterium]
MKARAIKSFDKTKIAFNHFKKGGRRTVLILCHGFWMSKDTETFLNLSKDLFKLYDVITMDQRGHGASAGVFNFSSKEHKDIRAVINYAKRHYKQIYLMGFSLGAASSIIEVARNKNVDRLIVVSPPTRFAKIENRFLNMDAIIPWIQRLGPHIFKLRIGDIGAGKISPIDVIDRISPIPLLIIHGDKDPIIFKRHAQALYNKAKEPKKIIIIKKGLHAEDLYRQNPKAFVNLCISWLKDINHDQRRDDGEE